MSDLAKVVDANKDLFSTLNDSGKKLGENTQNLNSAIASLSAVVN